VERRNGKIVENSFPIAIKVLVKKSERGKMRREQGRRKELKRCGTATPFASPAIEHVQSTRL